YHSHRVDSIKKSGISRWVELSADTLLNEQPDTTLHYWQVLDASPSRKPRICCYSQVEMSYLITK
ncbi:hypothetical protein, partial [Alkanindiges hydrocarboniclasticus]|uniref:hypothetical protein n=1 Tax=Alkanindiges hydrocarboniclasticus TaxID=1907941 RepID=UPI001D0D6EC8